jgi:Cu+-exporting ATPase
MSSALQLDIEGMTCASCATRIEKALNAVPGVEASVNYATERATILSGGADPTALLKAVEGAGYHASLHTEDSVSSEEPPDRLLSRLVVSAAITIPIVLLSMVPLLQFHYWQWVVSVLAIPVVTWGAWPFHRAAWVNAARAVATMDTLISLGVLAASGWSVWAMLFGGAARAGMTMTVSLFGQPGSDSHEIYWEVAAAVTTFMLLGRYLEHRAKRDAGAALRALMESGAKEATLRTPEGDVVVAIARVRQGDLMVVRPGERIPTDGEILEGSAAIDTSMMTGESLPRDAGPGDSVFGGTINTSGLLVIRATRVGKDTELARMAQLVENAQTGKSQAQRLADRVSAVFVPIVIVIAAVTFVGWLALGGPLEVAFQAAVATLIIACPCALGLATPTALLVGTGRGAQLGLLIRGPEVLEHSRNIDTVILDKTGTLTTGNMVVTQVISSHATTEAQVVALAAGVETGSEHPLAHAVLRYAGQTEVSPVVASEFHTVAGRGQRALVANQPAAVGQLAWLEDIGFTVSNSLREEITSAIKGGSTVIAVGTDSKVLGAVVIADSVKDTSKAAVSQLVALGLTPVMATGDNAVVAARIAREVGITSVYSGLTPEGKTALVTTLQEQGHQVAMVGDGINDAPALATADLGIAMGTGTDAAMTAGDITVVSGDLRSVSDAIRLARRTLGTIRVNLFWAFAYNVVAMVLAVVGYLDPMVAGAAMALSSLSVVLNALSLKRWAPTKPIRHV